MTARINVGAVELEYTPPEVWRGVISSAKMRLASESEYVDATVDETDLRAATESPAGTSLLLGISGLVVGRSYLAAAASEVGTIVSADPDLSGNTAGSMFAVVAVGEDDGGNTLLRDPLPVSIPAGARILGWHLTRSIPPAVAGVGAASWQITIGGETRSLVQSYEVRSHAVAYTLTGGEVASAWPRLPHIIDHQHLTLTKAISNAWRFHVRPRLQSSQIDVTRIRSWEHINVVLGHAVWYRAVIDASGSSLETIEAARRELRAAFDHCLTSKGFWYDSGEKIEPATRNDGSMIDLNAVHMVR